MVAGVAIQGGSKVDTTYWTTSYRVEFSDDCVAFQPLLNATGYNQVDSLYVNVTFLKSFFCGQV